MKAKRVILVSLLLVSLLVGLPMSVSAKKHHRGQVEQVTTITGTITEWTFNDDFEYDGLYLNTGSDSVFVKFPPHLGQQVRSLGNNVDVNGVHGYTPSGVQEFKMVSMSGSGQTVYDQKPISGATRVQEPFVSGEGQISRMHVNKKGETIGYILDNGVVLRISPRTAGQLSRMVQTGSAIGYTGNEKILKPGHVRAENYKIVRCRTITVNETQYRVR